MFLVVALLLSGSAQIQKHTCDHPAPPEGMHYVCTPRDSCNCHLVRDQPQDDEASASPASHEETPCLSRSLKHFVAPAYPAAARQARKQGTVTAQLMVDTSGQVTTKMDGDAVFMEAVRVALRNWRFAADVSPKTFVATFTFTLAGDPTEHATTTVSGSSPLHMVIAATPPLR